MQQKRGGAAIPKHLEVVKLSFDRPNIFYVVKQREPKLSSQEALFASIEKTLTSRFMGLAGIIFVHTRQMADDVRWLPAFIMSLMYCF